MPGGVDKGSVSGGSAWVASRKGNTLYLQERQG